MTFAVKGLARPFGLVGLALALCATPLLAQTPPPALRGPDELSNVIDQVIDSVVLISTSEDADGTEEDDEDAPETSEGAPLDQFFDDFFERQQRGENPGRQTGEGSGFVIDPAGTIVTNFHVVDGADRVEVTFNDGSKAAAEVIGRDKETDVAVLKVKPPGGPLRAARFGDADNMRIGQWVLAMGNPFGIGLSASAGIVSGRNRDMKTGRYDNFIQTDASINKGNSGGPLFNLAGEVVGMNTAILSPTGGSVGIGFAVPASTLQPVIDQLVRFGETRRGYIGVRIQDVPPEIAKRINLGAVRGALVAGVVDDAPAAKAGLQTGDVIVAFDAKPVTTSRALQRLVADAGVEREVALKIWREGKEIEAKITIGRQVSAEAKPAGDSEKTDVAPPPSGSGGVLGLDLAPLDPQTRTSFKIDSTIAAGIVVIAVRPDSPLKELNIRVGDVIVEVAQRKVRSIEELTAHLKDLKTEGQSSALALIANPKAEMRFLRLPLP